MSFFQRLKYLFSGNQPVVTPTVAFAAPVVATPAVTTVAIPAPTPEVNAEEPYIRILGEPSIDSNQDGVHLELEWNGAFVDYLRAHGYHGASEDLIVNKWLRSLYKQQSDRVLGSEFQ